MKLSLKYIIAFILALSFKATLAQSVEAQRVAFITKEIGLTSDDAQAFWPLYNEYNDKVKALRKNFRMNYGNKEGFGSEKEAEAYLNAEIKLKQSEVDLRKEYNEKFKNAIGVLKTARLRKAEEKFLRILLNTAKGGSEP